jgi:membrane-bound lytic murein transglycosylase D
VAELAGVNQISAGASGSGASLSGVEALVVPTAPVAAPTAHARLYVTRRGDTLVTIADRFGVSLSELRRWNAIPSGTRVDPGRRLHVADPAPVTRTSPERHHAVSSAPASTAAVSHAKSASGKSAQAASAHQPPAPASHTTQSRAAKISSGSKSSIAHKTSGIAKASP